MMRPPGDATELFCAMQELWHQLVPESFAQQNPGIITRFMKLADKGGGISRFDLQSELGLGQSNGSKLAKKLLEHGWITESPNPNGDKRSGLLRVTQKGREAMLQIESQLLSTYPARPPKTRVRRLQRPKNQITYFTDPEERNS